MIAVARISIVALLGLLLVAAPASAHASMNTEDGKYRITWGLIDEPGFTFSKNKLDLIIREIATPGTNATGAGVEGLTSEDVTVTLNYLDQAYDWGAITPNTGVKGGGFAGSEGANGNYTSTHSVVLTQPGIYSLVISGEIRGTPVNLTIPAAHEYAALQEIMFPREVELGAGGADVSALEARIAALESKLATQAATPTPVSEQEGGPVPGPGLLLAALAAVGVALVLRRRA